jgi:hypothetical protein
MVSIFAPWDLAFPGKNRRFYKNWQTNRRWGRSVAHHRVELTTGLAHKMKNDPAAR